MGWTDSHLHRFRVGNGHDQAEFLTQFDLDEGDEGMLEDDVRLDQIVAAEGDKLWYDYDFGDGWAHLLRVERVLGTPPETPRCVAGRRACPPEDCGGTWGYQSLATWVRGDFAEELLPEVFTDTEEGREWLPIDWHPDAFDIDEVNAFLTLAVADPPPVAGGGLVSLQARSPGGRQSALHGVLRLPAFADLTDVPSEPSADDAARMTAPFRALLNVIGDGAPLTGAGYLRPTDVARIANDAGIVKWWIGKANREDQTWPVARLRALSRALGLVYVRKGRIAPTRAARRCAGDPNALLRHILDHLPLGTTQDARDAGWAALAVVGSGASADAWDFTIGLIQFDVGPFPGPLESENSTLDVLRLFVSADAEPSGVDASVAAAARTVLRPEEAARIE